RAGHAPALPSFPTRRSSDLAGGGGLEARPDGLHRRDADLGGHAARPAVEVEDERAGDGGEGAEDFAGLASELAAGRLLNGLLARSEEHTSELQSRENLVCRL